MAGIGTMDSRMCGLARQEADIRLMRPSRIGSTTRSGRIMAGIGTMDSHMRGLARQEVDIRLIWPRRRRLARPRLRCMCRT